MAIRQAMWDRGGLSWWQLARRVWRQFWAQQLPGRCAELAYYSLFAVFPLLLFLTTLLGYLAGPTSRLRLILFNWLARLAPSPEVSALISSTLDQVTRNGGAKLSLSLLAAVWVASNAVLAVGRTLNSACGLEETRPWWRRRLVAVALTLGFAALVICGLAVMLYGHEIGETVAAQLGLGPAFVVAWHTLRWPLVLVVLLLSFEAIYNYAPCLGPGAHRPWGTPGAVLGVGMWLAATFGLRLYLEEVRGYAFTNGSVGAVIVLLLWFYLTAFAIVIGGEINSEIFRQMAGLRKRRPAGAPPVARRLRAGRG
jgi:membrane protein